MDINALKAFIAIARHESFSAAAEELHLTQPAVSKRIAVLEEQLGLSLFDRFGRQVRLSQHGETLLPKAREILAHIDEVRESLMASGATIAGTLSLAISHHIGLHRLPPVLRHFSERYPDVHLDIHFTDSEAAYAAIGKGELELAVITLAPLPQSGINAVEVWHDPLHFVAASDHPLAQEKTVTLAQLSGHLATLPDQTTYTGQIIQQLFVQAGVELNIGMATNYLETIKMMCSIGLGWSVMPATMLDDKLCRLELSDANAPANLQAQLARELGYIHRQNRQLSNAANAFVNTLLEHSELR